MHVQQFAVRYWLEGLIELITLVFFYMDLKWVQLMWRPLFLRGLAVLWILLPTEWLIVMGQNNGQVGCLRGQRICNIHLALCLVQLSAAFLLLLYDTMLDARRDIFPRSLRIAR
ncbi:hypothetical protein BGZ70_007027 [Mortierella alpina]|uniref:Transmembrane protein n=1 Tax=Mortierella alpina TaxID=64518 RepID=A0A9P6M3H4_MORAP|nr:hypothetical protein BGZ70_007027 [Mortierella alpina]